MQKTLHIVLFSCIFYTSIGQTSPANIQAKDSTAQSGLDIAEESKEIVSDNIPVISLDDNDFGEIPSQNISSLLTAGRDPFYSAAAYSFSPARFRVKGYDADFSTVFMNGIPMDNLDNGFTPYGLWGGLNDVMRNRDISFGLRYNTYSFGDLSITTNIDCRASKQRKQTSFGYAYSNRAYTHKWMLTYSTGINKKGIAFTFSGSGRVAEEGYVPGTYYNGWSYFIGIDKRFTQKNLLSFVAFGAPTENGRQGAAIAEMSVLAHTHYYNPYWGYQNGKKRNANVATTFQPVFILTHDFRINNSTSIITGAGYSFGKRGVTGIDWYNAPDPRPDYYRYLPSYQSDPNQREQVLALLQNNESARQINWQRLYDINRDNFATILNANGIAGNNVSGVRSLYVLQERISNTQKFNFNSVVNTRLGNSADFTGGISFQWQKNNYYQQLNDLLGGEFYVNLNQFAERDFPNDASAIQNDLNNPNRILKTGDKYGYNYDINITRWAMWWQTVFKYNRVDLFIATEVSHNTFWRVGNVRNGLFVNNSFGKSNVNSFTNYSIKSGLTYKINGRNYLYLNAAYLTRLPYFENAYISARTRDVIQENLTSESIQSVEGGYVLNAPKLKIRIGGYYTSFTDGFNVLTFYHEIYRSFINYAISNIDKIHFGTEIGFEAKAARNITITGAAAVGRYYYNSRQNAVVTSDNTAAVLDRQIVYSQNFRVPSTPQEAYNLGLTYRSPGFWFLSLTGNYFNQMWLDFNPLRRTYTAVEGVDAKSTAWDNIIDQTRLNAQYTIDFFGGYSYKLRTSANKKSPVYLVFNAGVNNLLNNKNIITGGYEQLRFDFDTHNPAQFPPKVYYGYGINYFLSLTVRY